MVVYYSRVRLRRFLCDQYRPARLAHYFEVFPQKVRGHGSSLGSLSVWVFNTVVTFTFFKIVKAFTVEGTEIYLDGENLGNPAGAFWFYAIVALAAIIWGYFYVPETKGVTLEKIEEYWRKGGKPRHLG